MADNGQPGAAPPGGSGPGVQAVGAGNGAEDQPSSGPSPAGAPSPSAPNVVSTAGAQRKRRDDLWYVPFDTGELISAYDPYPTIQPIAAAQTFTISLRTAWIAAKPETDFLHRLLHPKSDVMILSTSTLGTKPQVQRVHYYADTCPVKRALSDFLADTMLICTDYSGHDHIWMRIQLMVVDEDSQHRDDLLSSFTGLASQAGGVFPAILPYTLIATTLDKAVTKFIDDTSETKPALDIQVDLKPAGHGYPILRPGSYVVFDREVDPSSYTLLSNMELEAVKDSDLDVSYAIFTVDTDNNPSPDFVVSQRVATLLTQINKGGNDPEKSSLEFLSETLSMYGNFKDLQRYKQLKEKDPATLTVPEKDLMKQIEQNADLKPFLP